MSMISEQIDELRAVAEGFEHKGIQRMARQAADTIEELSAKLANANMERSTAYYNDGWISVSSGKLPENEERVWVVLTHTYEDEYIEYSVARYLKFENDECHWCEVQNGYLEWDKYSNGHGGSSFYKVIAWKPIAPYQPKGEK